jgi:photosystem II stability/assembly factor-like uncharacterized protein
LSQQAQPTTIATSNLLMDVTNTGERLVVVGQLGHILYSEDDGVTWTQAKVPVRVTLTAVYFPTPQKGWAVGHDGVILHTADAGESWTKQLDGSQINELILAQVQELLVVKQAQYDAATGYEKEELYYELDDTKFFLSDAEAAMEVGPARPFMDVWFKNEREGVVVGSFGMILRTEDGGNNWTPILDRISNPNGFHYYAIKPVGSSLFIAREGGGLYRSDDDGQNWITLDSPYEGSYFGLAAIPSDNAVLAFGLRGNTFRSADNGQSWQQIEQKVGSPLSNGVTGPDGTVVLVGSGPHVLVSTDDANTFGPRKSGFPGCISVEYTNDGKLILVGVKGLKLFPVPGAGS